MTKSNEKVSLQLTVEEAREMYKIAKDDTRLMLERNFGKSSLVLDVCERVKNLEDAYEETGRPRSFRDAPEDIAAFMQAVYDVAIFTEAMNEGERINIYNKSNRHYPWFDCNCSLSGFAFGGSDYRFSSADAGSGSRLSFKESRLSDHAARCILDAYRTMLDS